jgi:outer membrane protein TolC
VAPAPDTAELLADGYRHRPDLMALDAQILAAQADLDLAHLGLGPRLTSSGSLSLFNAAGQNNPSWDLGVALSIPILDSNNTRYTIELDQANLDTLVAQRTSLQNSVYQQVKVDVLSVRQSVSSIAVAREGVEAARQAFNLADERYKVGLDAQLAYVQARSTLVSAQASLEESNAQLNHDVGRTDFLEADHG